MSRGEDNGCHVISRTRCKDDAMPTPESIEAKCGLCEYPAKVGASRKLRASGGRVQVALATAAITSLSLSAGAQSGIPGVLSEH
jgi:hypothetical protein